MTKVADRGENRDPRQDAEDSRLATFELARLEELRLLELQRAQLDNIRTRTAQYLAFVGSASAFLAGSGLRAVDRDPWFYGFAVVATVFSGLSVAIGFVIFGNYDPRGIFDGSRRKLLWKWGHTTKGHALEHALSEVPPVPASALARKLAERYQRAREENEPNLGVVQKTHVAFLALGSLQLVAWTVVVWTRGG